MTIVEMRAMSVEELVEAMKALIDAATAEDREMDEEELDRYEEMEKVVLTKRRFGEVQLRQAAYEAPRRDVHVHTTAPRADDTLERAFEHYLRTGMQNQDLTELRAQQVGTDSEGGYLVPPGFRDKLVEVRKAFGGFAEEADTFSTSSGQTIEFPSLDDTANVGSITAEEAAFADGADLVFGTVSLGAFKYTSSGAGTTTPLRVSVELLQDSEFDIAALVARALGTRIARKQASDFVIGTGTTLPFGIVHTGLTQNLSVGTHDTLAYADLLATEGALDPAYYDNAKWLMDPATWGKVRAMVDGAQRPLILSNAESGIASGVDRQLLGYPVVLDSAMPNFPGAGNEHFIAFGDFREAYVIRRVASLTVVVNPYSRANFGQVEYVAWERADGNIQNRSAYVILDNTAS